MDHTTLPPFSRQEAEDLFRTLDLPSIPGIKAARIVSGGRLFLCVDDLGGWLDQLVEVADDSKKDLIRGIRKYLLLIRRKVDAQ